MIRRYMPAVVAGLLLVAATAAPSLAQEVKVATVNTDQVYRQIREGKDLFLKLDEQRKSLGAQEQTKRQNLNALKEQRDQFKPESDQFKEKNQEYLRAMIDAESWGRFNQADWLRQKKQALKAIFDKIEAAVAEIAKQKGIDVVIADQRSEIPNYDQLSPEQLSMVLNQRIILYSSAKADITNDVIAYLDKNYKGGIPAPAATPSITPSAIPSASPTAAPAETPAPGTPGK